MKLEIITLKDKQKWDDIVSSFEAADVYYLSGYVEGFKLHGDGEPLLFYFFDSDGMSINNKSIDYARAINVVMKRDIAIDAHFEDKIERNGYFDLTTPYGYGGLICEGTSGSKEILEQINCIYTDYCIVNNIVSEFVRFHPNVGNGATLGGIYDTIKIGQTVCIDITDRKTIWDNIISKNRNVIRKAQKSNVEIRHGMTEELINQFIQLYNATMDRDQAAKYYYFEESFYKSIMNDLKENATIFYAEYQNQIIAASIVLLSSDRMHYHLSASNAEFRTLAPTNLLLYEAACWGNENGYKTFHLGGGLGSRADNLFKFKKAFNRREGTEFWIGRKIFKPEIYEMLLNIRKEENDFDVDTGFFPKYRG